MSQNRNICPLCGEGKTIDHPVCQWKMASEVAETNMKTMEDCL